MDLSSEDHTSADDMDGTDSGIGSTRNGSRNRIYSDHILIENQKFAADNQPRPKELLLPGRRAMRLDDILWFICFGLTFAFFNIPDTLLFNRKVCWVHIKLMCMSVTLLMFISWLFRFSIHYNRAWTIKNTCFFSAISLTCLISSAIFFCFATWRVYSVIWSIYIAVVSTMAFLSFVSTTF